MISSLLMLIMGVTGAVFGVWVMGDSLISGATWLTAIEQSYEFITLGAVCAWLGAYK